MLQVTPGQQCSSGQQCSHYCCTAAQCRISRGKLHGSIRTKVLERCRAKLPQDKQGVILIKATSTARPLHDIFHRMSLHVHGVRCLRA